MFIISTNTQESLTNLKNDLDQLDEKNSGMCKKMKSNFLSDQLNSKPVQPIWQLFSALSDFTKKACLILIS